jgi:hypothetical protein
MNARMILNENSKKHPSHWGQKKTCRIFLFITAIAWALLYLPNLSTTPRWYSDETQTLGCGQDLVEGVFANRAVFNTYINPQFCYQPGYVFVVGLASKWGDRQISWPRLINSLMALGIALASITILGRRIGYTSGLLIALIFLTYEQTVIHFRWVYAHNAAALGFFICFACQCLRTSRKRSWQSGCGLAIAAASHPLALHAGLAAFLNRWKKPSAWVPTFLPPLLVGILCLSPILVWNFHWWWNDLHDLKDFYELYSRENGSGWQWPLNLFRFLTQDALHLFAALALIQCFFTRIRPIALGALVILALLTKNRQNLTLFYYQAVVVLPLLISCLGYGLVLIQRKFLGHHRWTRWAPFLLPFFLFINVGPKVWESRLVSRNDPWVVQSVQDHQKAADWLNQHTMKDDLVICHWNIGWLLRCRNADPLMCVAWEGMTTSTYEKGLPRERFRYDADIRQARFFVLTDIDRIWTLGQPNVQSIFNEKNLSGWQPVFQSGTCVILAPPFAQIEGR